MAASQSMQEQYNAFRRSMEAINEKIYQFETDLDEHAKVLEVLRQTDPQRSTKYMINNVLVDLSVEKVIPRVEEMRDTLQKGLNTLKQDLSAQEKSLDEWKKKHNVKVVS